MALKEQITKFDALLFRGKVMNLHGEMPILGYNPETAYEQGNMQESSSVWEEQRFNGDAAFRRHTFRNNVGGGEDLRISSWFISNPPVAATVSPTSAAIDTEVVTLTLDGAGFGADVTKVSVVIAYKPSYELGGVLSVSEGKNLLQCTVTACSDNQITATASLVHKKLSGRLMEGQTAQVFVRRLDRKLESDPVDLILH